MQESVIDPSIKQIPATSPQSLHTLTAGPESSRPNKDPHYSVVTTHSVPLPFHPVPFPFPQAPSLSFSTCPPEATCLIRSSCTPNGCSPVSSHSLSPHLTFRPTHLLTCSPCPLISLQNIIIPFLGTPWRIVKDPIETCPFVFEPLERVHYSDYDILLMSALITSKYSPRSSTGVFFCTCTRLLVWKSAVTSAKRRLFAAADHFKTLMKFLPLVWFSSCSACTAARRFEFFFPSSLSPPHLLIYFPLLFLFFLVSLSLCFSVLKPAQPRQSNTPCLNVFWHLVFTRPDFPGEEGGEWAFWHVYILFPFLCCIKKKKKITLSLFCVSHRAAN